MTSKSAHRPDIDGLRAIAVLGVLLYHFGVWFLPGGFTGVDVFFVISGFVITAKLKREMDAGEFSILGFYDGRVRRIVPALLTMLGVSLVAGWFLLLPGDYIDLSSSAAYAAAGLGNLFFYWNTSYFDQAAELQPLLHTWSLGVEEQFYLVWPLVLVAGLSLIKSRRLFLAVLSLGLLAAFVYAVRKVGFDPKGSFYFPHPRGWELATGALLVFLPHLRHQLLGQIVALAGAALVAWSFLALHATDPFPGLNAIYACVGAALIIWPKEPTGVSRVLALKALVGIGLISYSLYLWHWPVLVFFRHYANEDMPSLPIASALAAMSFGLAYLSWRFVEQPFRRPLGMPIRTVSIGLTAILLTAGIAHGIVLQSGFPTRLPADQRAMAGLDVMWEWECPRWVPLKADGVQFGEACNFGAPWAKAETKAILWGDSHAQHMAPLVEAAIGDRNISVMLAYNCAAPVGTPYLFELDGFPTYAQDCGAWRANVLRLLAETPDISLVMVAGFWSSIIGHIHTDTLPPGDSANGTGILKASIEQLIEDGAAPGRKFALITDVPLFLGTRPALCNGNAPTPIVRIPCAGSTSGRSRDSFLIEQGGVVDAINALASDNVEVIETGPAMCASGTCITVLNEEFLYRDVHHLRRNLKLETRRELSTLFGIEKIFDTGK